MQIVSQELKSRLEKHKVLLEQWSGDVFWLWGRCQPLPNKLHIKEWHDLMGRIATRKESEAAVEKDLEEAAIDVGILDGEDANEEWINESNLTGLADDLATL
jgi:hypothetical protein